MKYATIALGALLIAFAGSGEAKAQSQVQPYYGSPPTVTGGPVNKIPVDTTHGLPVTVTNTSSGAEFVQGTGAAGAPLGGVLSVQGVSGGIDQPVSIDQTTPGTTNGVVSKGGTGFATAQVALTATAVQVAAARTGRIAVTITVAGTAVDTFCGASGVTILTGDLLVGTKGASKTYGTSAAVFCVTGTVGTVTVAETF